METHKPKIATRRRAMLLATACLIGPLTVQDLAVAEELAELELSRRSADIQEAQELLRKGDEAYQAGRYGEAAEAFAGARDLIPDAPISRELRSAATERYAQATVEHARQLSSKGDVAGAKTAVDQVLRDTVAPNNPGALTMRAQLDDPIRTNPALDADHAGNVDEVRRLLYTAEGAYNLGKFDEAHARYEDVLHIDSTNTAARRGMERVAAAKKSYFDSAYDHTRAEMLGQVAGAWETPLAAPELGVGPEEPGAATGGLESISVAAKLDQIIIPRIALEQATLDEAIDFLRATTRKVDVEGQTSDQINFTVNLGPAESEVAQRIRSRKFNLQLSQLPLKEVLKHVTDLTGTSFTTDDFSVIITPAGSTSEEMVTRTYRVPPDFLSNLTSGSTATEGETDPFAETTGSKGLLTKRMSAQEALANQGIGFPEGASASYSAATNLLRVVNTPSNQDIIAQIAEALGQLEPVTVSVRVTMIRTEQKNLKELEFDWIVSPFGNPDGNVFGSGGTIGSGSPRTNADFINPVNYTTIPGIPFNPNQEVSNIVTGGLRSGDQGLNSPSIDQVINDPNRESRSDSAAPGILSVTGLFSDGQAQMVMRGLDQKKGVDVMARPSILTRSGQSASIVISREFIYPTEYEPPEVPNSVGPADSFAVFQNGNLVAAGSGGSANPVTPATPTAFETREVGINLEVLPVADANKQYVDITLNPSITDFDGFVNYGSPIQTQTTDALGFPVTNVLTENKILMPVFSVQKASTQLTVADGSTIVIGGLMADSIQTVNDKVPILGDIPFLGRLFQSTANQPTSTAIIFLVHVELLDPTGHPYRNR